MIIDLSPVRADVGLIAVVNGDTIEINGTSFDFSSLPDGATIPAGEVPCDWIIGSVDRAGGSIRITLLLPHGPNPSQEVAFPSPIIDPPDGALAIPHDDDEEGLADVET